MIDLRSDTVTLPSPAMRAAIAHAPLGDDVYGEDPSVNELERRAAERVGKEAALLVPSGTMGNLCALLAHAERGHKIVLGDECHIFNYEAGGGSGLGGLVYHTVPTLPNGRLDAHKLALALHVPNDAHYAPLGLVCLENTHNRCGGTVLPPAYLAEVQAQAHAAGVPLHLDGARVFNAAVALGVPVGALTHHVDTLSFCLSKGLAAPVGSILAGEAAFIARARRVRKMLGGGMRQAGIVAAAGLVALDEMVDRLADDHANAQRFARALAELPGIRLDPASIQTNIVIFTLDAGHDAQQLIAALRARGLLLGGMGPGRIRAVTHYGINAADIDRAIELIAEALSAHIAEPVGSAANTLY